jgi:hypothetical protein
MVEPNDGRAAPAAPFNWRKTGDLVARAWFGFTRVLMVLAFFVSLAITIADWTDLLDNWPELRNRAPVMTLLLISIIAIYLLQERAQEHAQLRRAVGRRDKKLVDALRADLTSDNQEQTAVFLNALESKGSELVSAVKGVFVKKMEDPEAYYRYLADRVGTAKRSIDDLTWGAVSLSARTPAEEDAYNAYSTSMVDACTRRKNLRAREVYTFPNMARLKRVEEMLKKNLPNYFVHFYDISHDGLPPLLQFTIIDGEEVIFGTGRGQRRTAAGEKYLSIRSRPVAEKFSEYFNTIWESGKPIRDPNTNDLAKLAQIRNKLERRGKPRS